MIFTQKGMYDFLKFLEQIGLYKKQAICIFCWSGSESTIIHFI